MAQRSAPAPFLTKTYQLVEEESTDDVVSWNETGTAFVVWKTDDFARDLLPSYFKHNNFSSFVRQLNTYGFRKVVPDKWEFANDCFRRGRRELLGGIRRRKAGKGKGGGESPSNSGEDLGSTSTSSSPVEYVGENEKLRKENESLRWELEQSTKRCEELIAFLTEYMKVEPEQINRIMRQGTIRDGDDEGGQSVKLFGVWVKGKDKRGRDEKTGCAGPHPKEMKMTTVDFHGTMKVCN